MAQSWNNIKNVVVEFLHYNPYDNQELNKSVDKYYANKAFKNDKDRIEFLFELYEGYFKDVSK